MTDGEALQRAVVADPDDDTPRLIYADWLEENGQAERAAFIRAHIEASRAEPFSEQARQAQVRAGQLLDKNRQAWTRHFQKHLFLTLDFQRGFIGKIGIEPIVAAEAVEAVFVNEPVQSLELIRHDGVPEDWLSLMPVFEFPQLRRVRRLQLRPARSLLDDEYTALAESPLLGGVRELCLSGNPIHPPWLEKLLVGEAYPRMNGLEVAEITHLGPALTAALTRANHREFRNLDLTGVRFTSDQLQRLLASRCLRQVERLMLGWAGRGGDPGPLFHLDLGWVVPWNNLVVLDLSGQRLGDEGVKAIVGLKEAEKLRWLGLAHNQLGNESIRLLAKAKYLDLNYLDIRGNNFSAAGIAAVQDRFPKALIVR
jgi:uncharacterized protein (TIGR02996 family)